MSAGATIRRKLLGVTFVVLVASGVGLSVASFNDVFAERVMVDLEAGEVGNQLKERSNVKARGMDVGQVDSITQSQDGATVHLALNPDRVDQIPADVQARILPTTLFGERFVSLEFDGAGDGPSLDGGDVITQDRSETAIELEEAFDSLLPTLQAVQPQKLNSTLTVMANALDGRGEQLGQTLAEAGEHFAELQPHLPELQENLDNLAEFAHHLSDATPDVAATFDNLATTSQTIIEQQQNLIGLYNTVTGTSETLDSFLEANQENIIRLNETSAPILDVVELYSPSFPCVIGQMRDTVPRLNEALGVGTDNPGLHAEITITPNRGPYEAGQDEPEYGGFSDELGYRGPYCIDTDKLPEPLPYPYPPLELDDGAEHPPPARSELDGQPFPCDAVETFGHPLPDGLDCEPGTRPEEGGGSQPAGEPADSPANTPAEHALLSELLDVQTGVAAENVPSWSGLLVGPLYRGAEVTIE